MNILRNSHWKVVGFAMMALAMMVLAMSAVQPLFAQPARRPPRGRPAQPAEPVASPVATPEPETVAEIDPKHPLVPAIALVEESLNALKDVKDYTCVFSKREVLNRRMSAQTMQMKFRSTPFSVYMRFQGGAEEGREVLFVEGQNKNNMLVHEVNGPGALLGTIPLAINSPQVTAENRHKITELGLDNLARKLHKQWQREAQFGEVNVEQFPNAKVNDVACHAVRVTHPQPRKQFLYHQTVLYVDKETRIPVRVENFGWPKLTGEKPPLMEEYTYSQLKTNAGLTDADFNARNRSYNFQ